jgi:AcrR family transcriptional regulator
MTKLSRAETPEEKVAKGEFILQVANRIIRDEGLEALSMNRLVQETGFAKGTLYLYFTTRHEILASLFVQMLTAWHHRLSESLTKARTYDEFCARYMRELTTTLSFCRCWFWNGAIWKRVCPMTPMRRSALHCNRF